MVRLKDLLPDYKKVQIQYRCNSPRFHADLEGDMLFGYCEWDGANLISGDGDNYYLNDIIDHHEWNDESHLTVWILVDWSSDKDG